MTNKETPDQDSAPVAATSALDRPETDYDIDDPAPAGTGDGTLGELVKFGLLAIVLAITLIIIAATRPLIFDRILPGVLGMDNNTATVRDIDDDGDGAVDEDNDDGASNDSTDASDNDDAAGGNEDAAPDPTGDEDSPTDDGVVEPGVGEDEGETPAAILTITYVVKVGDNLTKIAEAHGVTTTQIIEANNLANPNRIQPGDELIIPQPE